MVSEAQAHGNCWRELKFATAIACISQKFQTNGAEFVRNPNNRSQKGAYQHRSRFKFGGMLQDIPTTAHTHAHTQNIIDLLVASEHGIKMRRRVSCTLLNLLLLLDYRQHELHTRARAPAQEHMKHISLCSVTARRYCDTHREGDGILRMAKSISNI